MASVLIIAREIENARKLQAEFTQGGFAGLTATFKDKVLDRVVHEAPQLVVIEMDGPVSQTLLREIGGSTRVKRKIPIMVLVNIAGLSQAGEIAGADDFVIRPYNVQELLVRAHRLTQKNTNQNEMVQCEGLEIDLANCEVRVDGKIIELTFKEYELLTFLARDNGRVFSREALLNKVWGYDYFGGDRTVDVHVTRLRSKIEFSGQTYIETVRNIGYRFKKCK